MKSRRFVLTFPPDATGEPITYNLIRKFDIMVNIVKADVTPGQVGHLVMVHCGACSAVCFAGALTMNRTTAELVFDPEKCVMCELCLTACPLKLFDIDLG